ncbi:PQQ-dependent sugar dehydrogenase [Symbioplanes lichenis]|uniref:PQQ-dependent sugar dehydrogenase n=1 Tax=Symbioplanes lichenis TaxID=1629072 RepID=UPI0027393146|nr:gluconolaconase [Actinoplanes lichenis]
MKRVLGAAAALLLAGCSATSATPVGPVPSPAGDLPLAATTVRTLAGTDAAPFEKKRTLLAPPGWTVTVWARVPAARLLAWTPAGTLLVSRPKSGDVVELTPGAAAPTQRTLVEGLNQPHGLAFTGDTLYVAESDQVDRFTYKSGTLSGKQVVAAGLPDDKSPELRGAYAHALKSVTVGQDGTVYVSVGSTGNVSAEDREAKPERATILKVNDDGTTSTFARGVRNGTGLAVDPDGAVWTAVNNRDNIADENGEVRTEYVNDHPLEPLAKLTEGRDLGWPYCNPDPDQGRAFVRDVQLNPDGTKLDCGALPTVEQGMGAHSAPLGLSFGTAGSYGLGALVGVHGSWNRKPPRPPEVSFFAWRDGGVGPQQTLLTGFQLEDGSRWGRPVMAVEGPDKALYVSDDLAGAIYRVTTG